jgi:hypothetical protein
MSATWREHGVDADSDGRADPDNPADANFSAAAYLRASGAPEDLRGAIFAYSHADWYVVEVLATARTYATSPQTSAHAADDAACRLGSADAGAGVTSRLGANLPGHPLAPETVAFFSTSRRCSDASWSLPGPITRATPSTGACPITAGVPADRATAGPLPAAALREPAQHLHTAIATPPVADRRLRSSRVPRGGSAVRHRKSVQHDLRSARRSI